ncbi:MAG: diguanylate cyclase [Steroidobacteraceae bacterium]|nr:diguanylate cyclase [Steroidobacteraceae bacterium]
MVARTSLGILVLALLMGVLFSVMASWRVRAAEQERLIARVHELTATVESTVSVACFLKDSQLAKEIAGGLMKNRILAGVRITASGEVLHSAGSRSPANHTLRGAVDEITKTIYSPFDPATAVGGITLYVSHAEIEAQAIAYSRYTTWILGLQVAIVAAGVAFLVYLLVTRPIKGISDELHQLEIRSGMRLTVPSYRRTDEIGQLVMDVNALITRLSDALSTERDLRQERELSERRLHLIFEKADTGILVLGGNGAVQSCNPSFSRILGTEAVSPGTSLAALLAPNGPLVAGLIAESFESGQPRDADLEIEVRGRGKIWVELSVNPLGPDLLQGLLNDITGRKRAESAAHELAMRDSITGLLNRRGLDRALNTLLSSASAEPRQLALLLVDLDHFKAVNDTFGHAAGDLVLHEVASVLTHCVRRTDVVGRTGGDEFVVLLPGIDGPQKAEEIAHNIIASLDKPIAVGDGKFARVGASIGISLTSTMHESASVLLQRADVAMYAAKQAGRGLAMLERSADASSSAA